MVQLCREAVSEEAARTDYFGKQPFGNNCEIFGFTIQSQEPGSEITILSVVLQVK